MNGESYYRFNSLSKYIYIYIRDLINRIYYYVKEMITDKKKVIIFSKKKKKKKKKLLNTSRIQYNISLVHIIVGLTRNLLFMWDVKYQSKRNS